MARRNPIQETAENTLRLDKWLWAARFFKTRTLASEAINGGKVHMNGTRCKPSRAVQVGDKLTIQRTPYEYAITICKINKFRRPAKEAVLLYEESEESQKARETLAIQLKLQAASMPQPSHRPTKKERRKIIRFTNKNS
ncbi:MAG TPA: RNA-binding protein [Gammaproteobacteria bacterium]|nr:RNA-binding protein [Gammaproteobacteria bacterium]